MRLAESAQIEAVGIVRSDLRWPIESGLESLAGCRRLQSVPHATERKTLLGNRNKPFPDGA